MPGASCLFFGVVYPFEVEMTMNSPSLPCHSLTCGFPGCFKICLWHGGKSFSTIVRIKKFACSKCQLFKQSKVYVQKHIQSSCPTAALIEIRHDYLVDYCSTAKSCFPDLHEKFVEQVTRQANGAKPGKLDPEIYKRFLEPNGISPATPVSSSGSASNLQKPINTGQNLVNVRNQFLATPMVNPSAVVPKETANCTNLQMSSGVDQSVSASSFKDIGGAIKKEPLSHGSGLNLEGTIKEEPVWNQGGNMHRSQAAAILQKIDAYDKKLREESAATRRRLYRQIGQNQDTITMLEQKLHNLQSIEVIDLTGN
ncbi:unnamed protein product, partial [Mesorhabditis belari]|uniref:Uncharacterized protein n=2 Tax=Mesorhabditis belari TaxID=2138241 RepID=A0AAF3F7F4_9BILA